MADKVRTETTDGVLVITINRPDVRNAIDRESAELLAAAVDELDRRTDLTVGVLTGAGSTFCAGMDLKAFLAGERPIADGRGFAGIVERPPAKPLIAAVEGYALAGGFEIALACDLIVAADDATFGLPEVSRGLVAAGGGLLRLPTRAPRLLAMEWALTGQMIPAARAAEAFLVNRLSKPGEALATAVAIGRQIAANAPLAVRVTKAIIDQSPEWSAVEAFDRQREHSEPVRASEDAREGALAFTQKRRPIWRGV